MEKGIKIQIDSYKLSNVHLAKGSLTFADRILQLPIPSGCNVCTFDVDDFYPGTDVQRCVDVGQATLRTKYLVKKYDSKKKLAVRKIYKDAIEHLVGSYYISTLVGKAWKLGGLRMGRPSASSLAPISFF